MAGDIHPNPGPPAKYPCPVCARDITSQGVSYRCTRCSGWVHAKCSGLLNTAQYRTCDPCSASKTQQSTPPPPSPSATPAPYAELISDDSTFNVLQFNANGIGNKLTELGVVLETNKVKVAVIQESKLSSKSNNPCIRNYITVRKDRPHSHGGGLLVFIHESITFSKQPSSPETLSDPHLEELTIKADIGNTKLIISNIFIPPGFQRLPPARGGTAQRKILHLANWSQLIHPGPASSMTKFFCVSSQSCVSTLPH